jgi:hypothetical protein
MSVRLDFEFYVTGLEAALLNLLETGNVSPAIAGMTGVKRFATYAGELDRDSLLQAIQALAPQMPLVLASYGSGNDKQKAATSVLDKEPSEYEHSCSFVVIVACNDRRGEQSRKVNAYKMVAEVRQLLGGVQFETTLEGENDPILLNHSPFKLAGVETIGRLKDLTAYAVHFTTTFKEWTPDRRIVNVFPADEILLDVQAELPGDHGDDDEGENTNPPGAQDDPSLPGVSGEIK